VHDDIFGVTVVFFGNIEPLKPHNKYFLRHIFIRFTFIYITYSLKLDLLVKKKILKWLPIMIEAIRGESLDTISRLLVV